MVTTICVAHERWFGREIGGRDRKNHKAVTAAAPPVMRGPHAGFPRFFSSSLSGTREKARGDWPKCASWTHMLGAGEMPSEASPPVALHWRFALPSVQHGPASPGRVVPSAGSTSISPVWLERFNTFLSVSSATPTLCWS